MFTSLGAQRRRGARARTRLRTAASVGVIGLVAVCVAACGSSSSTSGQAASSTPPTQQAASSGAATQQVDMAAASKAIAPYEGQTSAFPVDTPLSKPLPADTKFVYLQCAATSCGQVDKLLQEAVKTLGGSLTTVSAGASVATFQTAAASALSLKPAVVFLDGFQPALFGDSLKTLSAAGIKVVSISMAQTPEELASYGITFNYIGTAFNVNNGKLMADWVITKKGANSKIAFYGVPEITFTAPMQAAFEQELKTNCASCKVRRGHPGNNGTADRCHRHAGTSRHERRGVLGRCDCIGSTGGDESGRGVRHDTGFLARARESAGHQDGGHHRRFGHRHRSVRLDNGGCWCTPGHRRPADGEREGRRESGAVPAAEGHYLRPHQWVDGLPRLRPEVRKAVAPGQLKVKHCRHMLYRAT